MISWAAPLAGLILLPVAGAALDATAETRRAGFRRFGSAVAHLAAASCAALLAMVAGHRPGPAGWDASTTVLVMLAGAAWVEAVFLSGIRVHHRKPALRSAGGGDPGSGASADDGGSGAAGPLGSLSADGEALLLRVLALESLPVEPIMTPRERMATVGATATVSDAVERMRASGHARLPVVADGSLDRILGVVHAKDLVPLVIAGSGAPLRRQIRRCLRVPHGQPVARLLADFRRNRVHLGIVTDPLGRTLGLVTMGDVFAHLAGTRGSAESARGDGGAIPEAPSVGGGTSP